MITTSAASVWPPGKESGPSREAGAARIGERLDSLTTLPEHSTNAPDRQGFLHLKVAARAVATQAADTTIRRNIELLMRGVTGERRIACRETILRTAATYRAITGEDWCCPDDLVHVLEELGGLLE